MSTVGKDLWLGCRRAIVLRFAATAIVLPLGCILVIIPIWLYTSLDLSIWWLIVPVLLFTALLFGGSAVLFAALLHRRRQKLDAAFLPLGLRGKAYQSFFRQYHGTLRGRRVDAYLSRGPLLEIEVSTSLQTRMGVTGRHGDTLLAASLVNQTPLQSDDPALRDLVVFARDEAWARELLSNPHAADILRRLTRLDSTFTRQQVILRPGAWQLVLSGSTSTLFDLDPAMTQQWVESLLRLAHISERLPPPTITAEISAAERFAYRLRERNPYLALWFGLGTLVFFGIAAVVIFALVFILTRR